MAEREIEYDRIYQMTSHFGPGLKHPGTLMINIQNNRIPGQAIVPGIKADVEDGILENDHFSFVMRKKLLGKTIEMKVDGTFHSDGTLNAAMKAPFGSSKIEGHLINH